MTVLVTGGAGFVGTHLCRVLVDAGRRVRVLDSAVPVVAGVEWVAGSFAQADELHAALSGCEGVVHLAGVTRAGAAARDPGRCFDLNVSAVGRLFETVHGRVPTPWLLLASSRAVVDEPSEIYGASKLCMEQVARAYALRDGSRVHCLRFADVYGGLDDHPDKVLPRLLARALADEVLEIDEPSARFEFVHIDDTVRGVLDVIDGLDRCIAPAFGVSQCRASRRHSLGDLCEAIGIAIGRTPRVRSRLVPPRPQVVTAPGIPSSVSHQGRIALVDGLRRLVDEMHRQTNTRHVA